MRQIMLCLLILTCVAVVSGQENPLAKSSQGDWAKFLITTKDELVPQMSSKDLPRWRVVSDAQQDFVRIDSYTMFGGKRRKAGGGNLYYFKDGFEPVLELKKPFTVKVVSTTKEALTVNGKSYTCTKIVRNIDQPFDESTVKASWTGTSTIWVCHDVPLGLVKMENAYQTKMSKSDKGRKLVETWVLAEFGFKNWSEK